MIATFIGRSATRIALVVISTGIALGGCASTGTQALARTEIEVLESLQQRLKTNRDTLDAALTGLKALAADAIKESGTLETSIAKAQLLESMKSPWITPSPELATTQKEVALYQLFALSEAQQELLRVRIQARHADIDQVRQAYNRLMSLTAQILENEKVVLAELSKPPSAQLTSFLSTLIAETSAFRQQLAESTNARVQALATDVAQAEERLTKAQSLIEAALERAASLPIPDGGD